VVRPRLLHRPVDLRESDARIAQGGAGLVLPGDDDAEVGIRLGADGLSVRSTSASINAQLCAQARGIKAIPNVKGWTAVIGQSRRCRSRS
jgi:hypothetical protein